MNLLDSRVKKLLEEIVLAVISENTSNEKVHPVGRPFRLK